MKKTKKMAGSRIRLANRSSELLINHRILYAVRDELKAHINSLELRIDSLEAKIDSHAAKVSAEVSRMVALYEEQNHRNKTVLEAYQQLYDRQDRLEQRQDEVDKFK